MNHVRRRPIESRTHGPQGGHGCCREKALASRTVIMANTSRPYQPRVTSVTVLGKQPTLMQYNLTSPQTKLFLTVFIEGKPAVVSAKGGMKKVVSERPTAVATYTASNGWSFYTMTLCIDEGA